MLELHQLDSRRKSKVYLVDISHPGNKPVLAGFFYAVKKT
ncbi:hypothetical protein ALO_11144 [Acetonema longum DSM 6540]|uniref:Uncharacterized protein n=1 Tax=Acetonema longum DSM 6540 TaxID=1009370 RepID=F7NJH3_9FIRM|nr:hypothetical protein ALO_11144 [Acetonema longum DSM 6540]